MGVRQVSKSIGPDADDQSHFEFCASRLIINRELKQQHNLPEPRSFSTDWFSNNIALWQRLLSEQKDQPDLTFLEVGCFEGRSTCWLLEHVLTHPTSRIVCVDTFLGSVEHAGMKLGDLLDRFQSNIRPFADHVRVCQGCSLNILGQFQSESTRFDFIYIDGSHRASDVLTDATLCFPLLKKGGLLVFDDYEYPLGTSDWERPKIAIDAFLSIYEPQLELLHKGYQVAVRRK